MSNITEGVNLLQGVISTVVSCDKVSEVYDWTMLWSVHTIQFLWSIILKPIFLDNNWMCEVDPCCGEVGLKLSKQELSCFSGVIIT